MCLTSSSIAQVAQTPNELVATIDDRIERIRKADIQLQLVFPDGTHLPAGTTTTAELLQHDFLFGCNLFSYGYQGEGEDQYRQRFAQAFNYATLNFIWTAYEAHQGRNEQPKLMEIAQWCRARRITTKGHPLVWSMQPDWVRQLSPERAEQLVWNRAAQLPRQFQGLIDTWDVINEPTEGIKYARQRNARSIGRTYERLGTAGTITYATQIARTGNPKAKLVLNDFVVTDQYTSVARDALRNGASIDAIGIQSHMHTGYWRVAKLWDVCERLSRLGKPIHFTELSIISGRLKHENDTDWETKRSDWQSTKQGEEAQAAQVYETYRLLFSHPAVEAISWWDLSDRGAWMGAPAGLLRADMTPKPAFYRVHDLIHKGWHTTATSTVDDAGMVEFRGFYGAYAITASIDGQTLRGSFSIAKPTKQSTIVTNRRVIRVEMKP